MQFAQSLNALTWGDRGDSNPRPSGPQPGEATVVRRCWLRHTFVGQAGRGLRARVRPCGLALDREDVVAPVLPEEEPCAPVSSLCQPPYRRQADCYLPAGRAAGAVVHSRPRTSPTPSPRSAAATGSTPSASPATPAGCNSTPPGGRRRKAGAGHGRRSCPVRSGRSRWRSPPCRWRPAGRRTGRTSRCPRCRWPGRRSSPECRRVTRRRGCR